LKLHLGCGDMIIPGFINCDLYNDKAEVKCDVKKLPYEDNSIDEIYNAHIIEHFDYFEALDVLKEWKRVLKPDGKLSIETPDFFAICDALVKAPEGERFMLYDQFFGKPWLPGQTHKFLYTENQLGNTLNNLGFRNIIKVPALRYIGMENICLRMNCIK